MLCGFNMKFLRCLSVQFVSFRRKLKFGLKFAFKFARVLGKKLSSPFFHRPYFTSITPFSRHPERNQKVPGRPGSWGPPWNLLVSLRVSGKRSYGRLNAGVETQVFLRTPVESMGYL
jgi:hypothetical protein